MDFGKLFSKERIIFILLFAALAFAGAQANFSTVIGAENQAFTFFQFFAPTAGAFLGPILGAVSVLVSQIANNLLLSKPFDAINILRLAPMLFGAYYFGRFAKRNYSAIVPLLCMLAFWLHPVGAQAWFYALYWLIPVAMELLFRKRLFARSLGATFTAHAIGSTLWLYTVPMPVEAWIALIPVVAYERMMFALGISASFIAFNWALSRIATRIPQGVLHIDTAYLPARLFAARARA